MLVLVMICLTVPAWAEDFNKMEVFGGFSAANLGNEKHFGWQGSFAYNATEQLGLVADFGGLYKTTKGTGFEDKEKDHSFLFGPRLNARAMRTTGFVHFLVGGTKSNITEKVGSTTTKESLSGFTTGIGGGMDVKATDKISIRILQIDWLPTHIGVNKALGIDKAFWSNDNIRLGFGVVVGLGGK